MTETTLHKAVHEHFAVAGSLAVTTTDISVSPLGLSESPTGGYRVITALSKTAVTAASYFPPNPALPPAPQAFEDRIQRAIQTVRASQTKICSTKLYRR